MSSSWVQPPAGSPGPRRSRCRTGRSWRRCSTPRPGQTVDGVQCQTNEQTLVHVHTHLTIFVNGQARVIPYGVGIPGFQAVRSIRRRPPARSLRPDRQLLLLAARPRLRRHHPRGITQHDAVLHPRSALRRVGVPLSSTQVGPATGQVTVFFTSPGKKPGIYTGNPRNLPWATTTRSSSTWGRRSSPPSRSPTGAACRSVEVDAIVVGGPGVEQVAEDLADAGLE